MSFIIASFLLKFYLMKRQPFISISSTFQCPNIELLCGATDDNEVHDFTYIGIHLHFHVYIFHLLTYRKPKLGTMMSVMLYFDS